MTERDLEPISPDRASEVYVEAGKHKVFESVIRIQIILTYK